VPEHRGKDRFTNRWITRTSPAFRSTSRSTETSVSTTTSTQLSVDGFGHDDNPIDLVVQAIPRSTARARSLELSFLMFGRTVDDHTVVPVAHRRSRAAASVLMAIATAARVLRACRHDHRTHWQRTNRAYNLLVVFAATAAVSAADGQQDATRR
jgi:hypothetical protein